ncbi:MAG TPA: radical SAM protein, partial [Burkholderiaceae bacterium]|nr:radical SAM protein [Burkholderiaceae bacterium]
MPSALPTGDPIPAAGPLADKPTADCALRAFSAYVHVPFCTTRCGYCDFNTYVADELRGATTSQYVTAVIQEVLLARKSLVAESAIPTVFFGGGTPSLLAAR